MRVGEAGPRGQTHSSRKGVVPGELTGHSATAGWTPGSPGTARSSKKGEERSCHFTGPIKCLGACLWHPQPIATRKRQEEAHFKDEKTGSASSLTRVIQNREAGVLTQRCWDHSWLAAQRKAAYTVASPALLVFSFLIFIPPTPTPGKLSLLQGPPFFSLHS